MKRNFFSFLGNVALGMAIMLGGCATPFNARQDATPSPEDTLVRYEPMSMEGPSNERVFSAPRRPDPEPETVLIEEEPVAEPEISGAKYSVQKGDCLYWVAKKFYISLRDLLKANGFDQGTRLMVGQEIILPGVDQAQVDKLSNLSSVYVVKKGDCLSTIAQRHGVTVREIKAANGLKNDRIVAGKKLTIPERGRFAKVPAEEKVAKVEPFEVDENGYYILQRGDSLSKIASKAHVTARELQEWNDIEDPLKIQIGQKILVRQSAQREVIQPIQTPAVEDVALESVEIQDPYSFVNDADFFGSVDDIPVVQI